MARALSYNDICRFPLGLKTSMEGVRLLAVRKAATRNGTSSFKRSL